MPGKETGEKKEARDLQDTKIYGSRYTEVIVGCTLSQNNKTSLNQCACFLLLRGTLVNRTHVGHKNIYNDLFFPTIFGPIYYRPP